MTESEHEDTAAAQPADETADRPADETADGEEHDPAEIEQLEKERAERLAPENRPANAEVDNTDRDFNFETGRFEDYDAIESDIDDGETEEGLQRTIDIDEQVGSSSGTQD